MMTVDIKQIEQMIAACSAARTVLIATHVNPDGDAIGSSLALAETLEKQGKRVVLYDRDPVPYMFTFLPLADNFVSRIPEDEIFDLLLLLDCSELSRTGDVLPGFSGYRQMGCIDHHVTNDSFAQVNLIDAKASATAELVYEVISRMDPDYSREVAINLYTGIITDTGSFHYANSTPHSFVIAGEMVNRGVDPWMVAQQVYESEPVSRLQLLGHVLQTLQIAPDGKAACVTVTQEMYALTGTNAEHTDRLVNYPRSIAGVEVAFFLRQDAEKSYKLSFRSRGKVDVASLAQEFGGGGHKNAAGCNLTGTVDEIIQLVFRKIDNLLHDRGSENITLVAGANS
jgi:phosphoesterase RecJ-like protein